MTRFGWFGAALFVAGLTAQASAQLPPLIPREVLFGNPDRAGPKISPTGKHLAYLRPDDKNVLQVWVRTVGKEDDHPVTEDPKRGIRQYFWAKDGKYLLYLQDTNGDENDHLYATDPDTKKTRELTPFPGVKVAGVDLDEKFPDQVIVGLNKRNKAFFDAHRVTISTGEEKVDTENPGNVLGWVTDDAFQVRAALAMKPDGGQDLLVREKVGAEWKKIKSWSNEEQGSPAGFGKDPNTLYLVANDNANASRLVKLDLASGKEEVIAEDKEYDVSGAMIDEKKRIPLAVSLIKARKEWKALDESVKFDLAALAAIHRGDFSVTSETADQGTWVVAYVSDDGPVAYYLWDRKARAAKFLFVNNSKLQNARLARMEPVEFKAKDGLTIHAYLTRPVGLAPKNLPTVLLVHGGPWARDTWGYDPMAQWLANRGYAVLQVNYRGSTGYGKAFLNAGNREWAGKMHQDLIDGVDWLIKSGVSDPKKIAIAGGSYGGYATLVGLTFTPDVFCCGVDIVGPSSIPTLINSIPPYWKPLRGLFDKRVGNIDTEEAFLKERSPLSKVDRITKPLLIGQGANDPRVKQAESDQIVEAMRKNMKEVRYIVYTDEGHGFARPENRLHFFAVSEEFLAKHLGGRTEPMGEIKGHSGVEK
ncbi:MAG TPA: S9 family peptidase [Gemmataceae bacterium]|nr:S9 family peptidase [Gemmataceae bacterium]